MWLNQFKIPTCIFLAKYGLWPTNDVDLLIVIGKGMRFPKIENASSEDVDKYHKMYINELCDMFDRHKGKLGIKKDLILY